MSEKNSHGFTIPSELLPSDGRFGCGPSKIRPDQIEALVTRARSVMGTSHRQPAVKNVVKSVREGLMNLFGLPDDWEIILGNGGSTVFWDVATFSLVERRSQHLVFGEFSSKFAEACGAAPHLDEPVVTSSEPGTHPELVADPSCDTFALTHNETSTGVAMSLVRPDTPGLVVVDATSAAGGLQWHPDEVDVYYFAPQKCFASDGGLWIAACSPAAIERIRAIHASKRWIPASLDLHIALENSVANQTYNTPALATLIMLDDQVKWMNDNGGLAWTSARCKTSADMMYSWAESREWAQPFVANPSHRSNVVATIDLEGVDANTVSSILRSNGIVDTESYRKLGRNQMRVGLFPAIEPSDVELLTKCIDVVVDHLRA